MPEDITTKLWPHETEAKFVYYMRGEGLKDWRNKSTETLMFDQVQAIYHDKPVNIMQVGPTIIMSPEDHKNVKPAVTIFAMCCEQCANEVMKRYFDAVVGEIEVEFEGDE